MNREENREQKDLRSGQAEQGSSAGNIELIDLGSVVSETHGCAGGTTDWPAPNHE